MSDAASQRIEQTDVFITRVFNAPRPVVFKFWTDPAQVAKWWGPIGYHNPREDVQIDLRVGGVFQLRMADDAGTTDVWVRGRIVELVIPEVLAIHLDVPQPHAQPPMEVRLRVQFHDHGDKTRITLHQGPFSTTEGREHTIIGWSESFDELDRQLPTTDSD